MVEGQKDGLSTEIVGGGAVGKNSLSGFQTGGRRSPFPLGVREYGFQPWYQLSPEEKAREIARHELPPVPDLKATE